MIIIALGANLPSEHAGPPRATLECALAGLQARGIAVTGRSRWYESAPVPASDQPWFVNAVASLETDLAPGALMRTLHDIEALLGRVRDGTANAARAADLDLIDYHGRVSGPDAWPRLPHPRMESRAFVVKPLAELAPDWRHPVSGATIQELLRRLSQDQVCNPLPEGSRKGGCP
ncbi:2-amino-4-hydroxy-6-hydroxymethyldihydropteridine diphosphokinase [Ferruginivarius sediminum]|uniref:2-amino-4-hydroxy-6-hydroxymethyldihydropteridine pyrophosphokinase n=1 Tax=Ferruginivarius sediminum TaxID=2661937 RepID=A0A369TEQ9_9PROT|nr:2-amino-4-hydroxy-6-hydroxymethyldihydropteridine diphosphokinase [Ferruginivarius sediminum]RDD63740.1 2-amino-4-hydroxy-6-hydroxymethyldihydropteridine diphosphokinase [Ferruginivarius sediminum]